MSKSIFFDNLSLRKKLTLFGVFISAIALLLMLVVSVWQERKSAYRAKVRELQALGAITAANSSSALIFLDPESAQDDTLRPLQNQPTMIAAVIYDASGKEFAKFVNPGREAQFVVPEIGPYEASFTPTYIDYFAPVLQDGELIGTVYLRDSLAEVHAGLEESVQTSLIMFLVAALISWLLAIQLQRFISRPVLELSQTAERIAREEDYSVRAVKISNDEVGQLIERFNEMIAAIEERDDELVKAQDELEARVEERTAELRREVGERKSAEKQFRQLLESAPDAMVIVGANSEIILVNSQTEKLFGYQREDLLGQTVDFLIAEGFRDKVQAASDSTTIPSREASHLELVGRSKTGKEIPVEVSFSPLEARKGSIVSAAIRDITLRKQAEEELRQAMNKAEAANVAKSEFLANMSHEIRTPMNGIIGMTSLLLDTRLESDQREFAETIRTSSDALLAIINDILDFSKIEAGKLQLEAIDFDLRSVVENSLDIAVERAHSKGLELTALIHPEVPTMVCGDPGRIRQILTNLLSNAVKFTESGEVAIEVTRQSEFKSYAWLHFEVRDTGIGIPPSVQTRLFAAFSQADGSTTRKYGGTGLGLAICKKLAETMGGWIGVKSEPGKGSCFWFEIPLEKQEDPAERAAGALAALSDLRVIVVDDNATNRKVLSYQLKSWGIEYSLAVDAQEALELVAQAVAEERPFDVGLLDMQMPGMNGLELARKLRQDLGQQDMRLILLTSLGRLSHEERRKAPEIDEFLVKPLKQSRLFDTLMEVLHRGTEATPQVVETEAALVADGDEDERPILLVEDNAINQRVAIKLLQRLGRQARVASNGVEALDMLSRESFSLVLMDCQMPEMDGYEASRRIRQQETGGKRIPIVAMTAHAMQGDREKCLEAGMDDYISKPVRLEDLGAAIERVMVPRLAKSSEAPMDSRRLEELRDPDRHPSSASLGEALSQFRNHGLRLMASISDAVAASDAPALRLFAGELRRLAFELGARRVAFVCSRLERQGELGELGGEGATVKQLRREMALVDTQMREIAEVTPNS